MFRQLLPLAGNSNTFQPAAPDRSAGCQEKSIDMKFKLFGFAALLSLALLSGCAKSEFMPETDTPSKEKNSEADKGAISFGFDWTKAIVNSDSDLKVNGNQISIVAFQSTEKAGSAYYTLIPNSPLTYNSSTTPKWTYTPLKYWRDGFNYKFISIYPYSSSYTVDEANQKVTFAATTKYAAGDTQTNWLAAYNATTGFNINTSDRTVDVGLKQCASLLSFNLKNETGRKITVTSAKLYGHNSKATCTVSNETVNGIGSAKFWSNLNTPVAESSDDFKSDKTALEIANDATAALYSQNIVVIPQTLPTDAVIFSVTYHFEGGTDITVTKSLHNAGSEWEQGKQYTYNFSLKDDIEIYIETKFWKPASTCLDIVGEANGVIVGQPTTLNVYVYFPSGATSKSVKIGDQTFSPDPSITNNPITIDEKDYYRYVLNNYSPSLTDVTTGANRSLTIEASAAGYTTKTKNCTLPVWGISLAKISKSNYTTKIKQYEPGIAPKDNLLVIHNDDVDDYLFNNGTNIAGRDGNVYDYKSLFGFSATSNFKIYTPLTKNYVLGSDRNDELSLNGTGTSTNLYTDAEFGLYGSSVWYILGTSYRCWYQSSRTSVVKLLAYGTYGTGIVDGGHDDIQQHSIYNVTLTQPH